MHDIWEPELRTRINHFIARKAKQYPDLHLTEQRDTYDYTEQHRRFTRVPKQVLKLT